MYRRLSHTEHTSQIVKKLKDIKRNQEVCFKKIERFSYKIQNLHVPKGLWLEIKKTTLKRFEGSCRYENIHFYNNSSSSIQIRTQASDGIMRSPRGDTESVPTFGPSGRQERLNCWVKNLR